MANLQDYIKAGDTTQSPESLWKLYYSNSPRTRLRLAENPSTPEDLLEELARDLDCDVRAAVAVNPQADRKLLQILVEDENINVRLQLASEPGLPVHLLEKLAQDENPYVRDLAEGTLDIIFLEEQLKEMSLVCEPGHIARVGKLFIDAELISEEDLEICLSMSQSQEVPVGQILIRQKHFSPDLVLYALRMQTQVRIGKLSLSQAVSKLKRQANIDMPLAM